MGDEEEQETLFQEMDSHQLAAKTAWVKLFLREASKRGYTVEDIVALLDEPGMTVKEAVERILSARKVKQPIGLAWQLVGRLRSTVTFTTVC